MASKAVYPKKKNKFVFPCSLNGEFFQRMVSAYCMLAGIDGLMLVTLIMNVLSFMLLCQHHMLFFIEIFTFDMYIQFCFKENDLLVNKKKNDQIRRRKLNHTNF